MTNEDLSKLKPDSILELKNTEHDTNFCFIKIRSTHQKNISIREEKHIQKPTIKLVL